MRYVTFSLPDDPTERFGAIADDRVVDVTEAVKDTWPGPAPDSLLALIQAGPDAWQRMASMLQPTLAYADARSRRLQDIRWHAPIPRPRKNIFCLGQNYLSHAKEAARARERELKIPEVPVFFTKTPTTVTGPYDAVPWDPSVTESGGLRSGARRHRRRQRPRTSRAPRRSSTSSATPSSTTCRRATCRKAICSGSRARASTAFARWARASSPPTSSAIRRTNASRCG